MVVTNHAVSRALERLYGVDDGGSIKQQDWMQKMLKDMIKPSKASFLDGTKYMALIDGFDFHRAVIKVENNIHILITITPIK
jgi:hypothetical protein